MLTSGPASILLRRRPTITSPATQTGQPRLSLAAQTPARSLIGQYSGVLGEIVHVVCEATSAPAPTGVIWTYMGRTIHTGEAKQKHKWITTLRDKNFIAGFYSKVGRDPVGIKAFSFSYKSQLSSVGIYDQHQLTSSKCNFLS